MVDPQKNLITINRFSLFMLCAGCICTTVLIALPSMIKQTGNAAAKNELIRMLQAK